MNTSDRFLRFAAECEVHGQIQPYPGEQGCLEWAGTTMDSLR